MGGTRIKDNPGMLQTVQYFASDLKRKEGKGRMTYGNTYVKLEQITSRAEIKLREQCLCTGPRSVLNPNKCDTEDFTLCFPYGKHQCKLTTGC